MRVYNWKYNCEQILKNDAYTTKNQIFKEQIYLVRYLLDQNNNDQEVAYNIWKKIPSKYTVGNSEYSIRGLFHVLLNKAAKITAQDFIDKIVIYQGEIDYINKLDVHVNFKHFLLLLLAYSRSNNRSYNMWDHIIRSELLHLAGWKRVDEDILAQIAEWNHKYCLYEVFSVVMHSGREVVKHCSNILLHYDRVDEKDAQYEFNTVEEVAQIFHKFAQQKRICPTCGVFFNISSKAKTDLCPACYTKYRKKRHAEIMRNSRKKK